MVQKSLKQLGELDITDLSEEFSRKWQRVAHGRVNEMVHVHHANEHLTSYTEVFDPSTVLYRYGTVMEKSN